MATILPPVWPSTSSPVEPVSGSAAGYSPRPSAPTRVESATSWTGAGACSSSRTVNAGDPRSCTAARYGPAVTTGAPDWLGVKPTQTFREAISAAASEARTESSVAL